MTRDYELFDAKGNPLQIIGLSLYLVMDCESLWFQVNVSSESFPFQSVPT